VVIVSERVASNIVLDRILKKYDRKLKKLEKKLNELEKGHSKVLAQTYKDALKSVYEALGLVPPDEIGKEAERLLLEKAKKELGVDEDER